MRRSTSPTGVGGYSRSGASTAVHTSTWERCRNALPRVRGMRSFTWAMTSGARRAAGRAKLTETPRERWPLTGGAVWTITASGAHGPPAAKRRTVSK